MRCRINAIFIVRRTDERFRTCLIFTLFIVILNSNQINATTSNGKANLLENEEADEQSDVRQVETSSNKVTPEYDDETELRNKRTREQLKVEYVGESYQGQYNNLSRGCSTRCSITGDKSLSQCWLSTLTYFERVVVGVLRRFVTVQTNRMIWEYKHEIKSNFTKTELDSINRLSKRPTLRIRDANRAFTPENIRQIVQALFFDIQRRSKDVMGGVADPPPTLECPRACEKRSIFILWLPMHCWLFIISSTVTVALASFIIVAIFILEKRENRITKSEVLHYGDRVSASTEPSSTTSAVTSLCTFANPTEVKMATSSGTTKTSISRKHS